MSDCPPGCRENFNIYSQHFYGKYSRRSSFHSFLTVFWILSWRIRRKLFLSATLGSPRTLWRDGEKDDIQIFFHFLEGFEDSRWRQYTSNRNWYFSKRNMEKYQTAGRLVIWRPCPVVSGENFLSVTLGSLRTLCTRSAKRRTLAFFHFLEALEDCKWR